MENVKPPSYVSFWSTAAAPSDQMVFAEVKTNKQINKHSLVAIKAVAGEGEAG